MTRSNNSLLREIVEKLPQDHHLTHSLRSYIERQEWYPSGMCDTTILAKVILFLMRQNKELMDHMETLSKAATPSLLLCNDCPRRSEVVELLTQPKTKD